MKLRPFGDTGINVSEVGLGAWQLANPDWGVTDRNEAARIIQKSLEAGCNFFDTAPAYGQGVSEELLGQVLKSVRKDVILCTKFGHTAEGVTDFSPHGIRPSMEASLKRLQTDYLDIVLMHNPPREMMDGTIATQYEEFEKLKAEGKTREYGVSLDWREEIETASTPRKAKRSKYSSMRCIKSHSRLFKKRTNTAWESLSKCLWIQAGFQGAIEKVRASTM